MNRRPTTFALVLALLALALVLALGLSAVLSARLNRQIAGIVYGRLASATAMATDELALRHDAGAEHVLARLAAMGVRLATGAPSPSTVRVAPVALAAGRHIREQLDDPMRVVVVQNPPLARRLFCEAALDDYLPADFHAEVARIIVWVLAMRKERARASA